VHWVCVMPRIWIDITNIGLTNLLASLACQLKASTSLLVTTSSDRRPSTVLDYYGVPYRRVAPLSPDAVQGYAERVTALSRIVEDYGPDLLVSDRDPAAVRTAFGLGVPTWTIFSFERSMNPRVEKMTYPLCEKIFASAFLDRGTITQRGVAPDKIVRFDGFNECYLTPRRRISVPPRRRILIRPNGNQPRSWVDSLIYRISKDIPDLKITVLANGTGYVPNQAHPSVDVLNFIPYPPVINQDLFVGWGRILGESFSIGIPSIRTTTHKYPDLSVVYREQPVLRKPEEIASTMTDLLYSEALPENVGLESPVDTVLRLLRQEYGS